MADTVGSGALVRQEGESSGGRSGQPRERRAPDRRTRRRFACSRITACAPSSASRSALRRGGIRGADGLAGERRAGGVVGRRRASAHRRGTAAPRCGIGHDRRRLSRRVYSAALPILSHYRIPAVLFCFSRRDRGARRRTTAAGGGCRRARVVVRADSIGTGRDHHQLARLGTPFPGCQMMLLKEAEGQMVRSRTCARTASGDCAVRAPRIRSARVRTTTRRRARR